MTQKAALVLIIVLLALAAVLIASRRVRAQAPEETWRIAGTMNGWNTGDDRYRLVPVAGESGRLAADVRLEPGVHRFKFVKDGGWDRGHLGADATKTGGLIQPGDDIPLRTRVRGVYRITLDVTDRAWQFALRKPDETFVATRVYGPVLAGKPFRLSASESVTSGPIDGAILEVEALPGTVSARVEPDPQSRLAVLVTPARPGPLTLRVSLVEGESRASLDVILEASPAAIVRYVESGAPGRTVELPLEPQGNGVQRAILQFAQPTSLESLLVEVEGGTPVRSQNSTVPSGAFAVETRGTEVVTHGDRSLPAALIPGNWRRFVCPPTLARDNAYLLSEFNNLARPGQPGATALQPRTDGGFACIVAIPDGPFRYRFLVDREEEVPDPYAPSARAMAIGNPWSLVIGGPTAAEYPPASPTEFNLRGLRHYSHLRRDFLPISRGLGVADVSLSTVPGDADGVRLVLDPSIGGAPVPAVPMTRSTDEAGFDRWSARILTGVPAAQYFFILDKRGESTRTSLYNTPVAPEPTVPSWAMGAVWYQIFPERFRNGNPLNDPRGSGVFLMPWTADWYSLAPGEAEAWKERAGLKQGDPLPARQGGPLFNVVWDRRYGGDLQGVAQKLDELKELGVTAIYLNPIFQAESLHKYDASDFRHIDHNLGAPRQAGHVRQTWLPIPHETTDPKTWTWTPADRYFVDDFLPACRRRGIRVIIDGVFNHTGKGFWAFRDIMEKGKESPYADWYFCAFDEQGKLKSWQSWFDTGALPKFCQNADGDLVAPVKEHIFNITRRWMDPDGDGDPRDGVDGWRLDVALDVGMPFWHDWRKLVKSINPEALIVAEIWDDASAYLTGDAFDTQMHYPFARAVVDWVGVRPGMGAKELGARLGAAFASAPQMNLIHQNLLDSHDTDRFVSMLLNPAREYDQGNRPQDHDFPYKDHKPDEDTYKRSLLGVAIQATYLGAPMIYYGDEYGMWGADDPTDRKPLPWVDVGRMQNPDEAPNLALRREYAKWFNLRHANELGPILRYGDCRAIDSGDDDVFVFQRTLNGKRVVVAVNRKDKSFNASRLLPNAASDPIVPAMSARYWLTP